MDKSDSQDNRDNPKGGTGPRESSGAMRKWLDNFLTPGEAGAEPPADPIARNPNDEGKPGEPVQAAEVRRRSDVSEPPVGAALVSAPPGGLYQRPQATPATADLMASVLRFKWTILIVWVLVSAPILAAVWTQIAPQYVARAEIRVRPIIPRLVFKTDENGQIPFYDSFVNTQVSIIRSPRVLQQVLLQDKIKLTRWFQSPPRSFLDRLRGGPTDPVERLRNGLSVRPRPRTEIIDVAFTDVSAGEAMAIVDAVVDRYIQDLGDTTNKDQLRLDVQLTDEYNKLSGEIMAQEKVRAKYRDMLQTDSPQELIASKRARLDEMRARLKTLTITIKQLGPEVNDTKQTAIHDSNDAMVTSGDNGQGKPKHYEDAEWRRLDLEVRRVKYQVDMLTDKHPNRARLVKDSEFAEELLRQREKQLDEQWQNRLGNPLLPTSGIAHGGNTGYDAALASPQYRLAEARREAQVLAESLKNDANEFKTLFDAAQRLEKADAELRVKREMFDTVRQRMDQRNVERVVAASVEPLTNAFSPSKPAQDRRVVFSTLGLFAGLGLGFGAAFLRSSRSQTIYALRDMPQPAQAPFLGYVPLVHLRKPLGKALSDEIGQSQFLLIESVRVLRTALLSRLQGQGKATVVVTSASEGTGKSSFTLVLGKSIAQAGRKVLVIDADFHKMTLSKRMQLLDKPGLRESLKDKTAESQHVFPTETAGLDFMPAGRPSKGSLVIEEIANGTFKGCVGRLFEQHGYDIILLDTPPIMPVADAIILAGQVDGTILVEREHVSRRMEVANALVRLGSAGGHLLGTVFVGSPEQDHYGYGFRYRRYAHGAK